MSDSIIITGNSNISSNNAGCQPGVNLGSPGLVVGQGEDCGLNGGSYGGRGGIGLSSSDFENKRFNKTESCILNSVYKMKSYGSPLFPDQSGSSGQVVGGQKTDPLKPNKDNSAGSIVIFSKSLFIDKNSKITSSFKNG